MSRHGMTPLRAGCIPPSPFYQDGGKFGRIFSSLAPLISEHEALVNLGKIGGPMDEGTGDDAAGESRTIPAGFTFLGQFIDHDITLDTTSSLERQNDPTAIRNFRTPVLELDNVYGSGPEASPYLYDQENPAKLLIGTASNPSYDLPRNRQNRALIGDPRNDENLVVSQLHLAFLKFHNAVVDHLKQRGIGGADLFHEAQQTVRWHYQWIVLHEYLPLIVGQPLLDNIQDQGRQFYQFGQEPFIPVEFSVAAFRLGHSQVRNSFQINDQVNAKLFDLSFFNGVPVGKAVDWRNFFKIDRKRPPQFSKKLDAKIASILLKLPFIPPSEEASLATRNLLRGQSFSLPSGQAVTCAMGLEPLSDEQLEIAPLGFAAAPLWYYILKEAEILGKGETLGPVGGRLVAEVFLGLLEGDYLSYQNVHPCWKPTLPAAVPGTFTMADLLRFAGVAEGASVDQDGDDDERDEGGDDDDDED